MTKDYHDLAVGGSAALIVLGGVFCLAGLIAPGVLNLAAGAFLFWRIDKR